MRKKTITQQFFQVLDGTVGLHARIAKECGIGQATISRAYLRKASPRLDTVQAILDWSARNKPKIGSGKRSASRAAIRANVVDAGARTSAAAPLSQ